MELNQAPSTSRQQFGWIERDADSNIIIGENGCVSCISEGGTQFEVSYNDINFNYDTLEVSIDNETVYVKVHDDMQHNNLIQTGLSTEIQEGTNEEPFTWTDANTKLFLDLYKDAITNQRMKTKKILWRKLSESLQSHKYNISPAQVENKFKSLERSYKNMIANNKKTGRSRISCSYENELTELFANKHNIIPLATMFC